MSSYTASTHKASSHPAEDENRAFKKTEQVVGRPPVTDHDINDEYLRDPPRNVERPIQPEEAHPRGLKEGVQEREPLQEGVLGHEEIGREKVMDRQTKMLNPDDPLDA
ncbi:uncharacterized protein STEHIDRAFT_157558 [Stereum hirsutum FP-91666 SS1]|uniref:uncharacterized protein n=1 Tax=Stereum hirsutum (strain FP-91666) TaxID=721885 RepID=UPI0004449972|nr:uncharacterized protein STEHIDRAFT_157558 [Stereum hirsutum FP-91666 SS1]EIM86035.1 hypothetical protein STEHIDRAFT_157558 [Stereum hirsutum FP-91666 SS1]